MASLFALALSTALIWAVPSPSFAASFSPLMPAGSSGNRAPRVNGISPDGSRIFGSVPKLNVPAALNLSQVAIWDRDGALVAQIEAESRAHWEVPIAVSENGDRVLGLTTASGVDSSQAFVWDAATGEKTFLSAPPSPDPNGSPRNIRPSGGDLSDDGSTAAGFATLSSPTFSSSVFIWDETRGAREIQTPDQVAAAMPNALSADGSRLAGTYRNTDPKRSEAFIWDEAGGPRGLGDLDGGDFLSEAQDLSADGRVVVGSGSSSRGLEAFRWTEAAGMIGLGDLPGGDFESVARYVSADGTRIVGTATTEAGPEAFIWEVDEGMQSLQVYLMALGLDVAGWQLTDVRGLSADGLTILGHGRFEGLPRNFIAVIPEPSTGCLMLIGLSLMSRRGGVPCGPGRLGGSTGT